MKIVEVPTITSALLFKPTPHIDERGFFCRIFDQELVREAGLDPHTFLQDSVSRSGKGVIRGLHIRSGAGEAKLVRCSYGAVFDVVVDLRRDSSTFRNVEFFHLTDENQNSVYIPAGCAHGFQALTDPADVMYRINREHDPTEDVSIAFDDPQLAIPWPISVTKLSVRDRTAPSLAVAIRSLG